MNDDMKKIMSVFAVLVMALAGTACVIIQTTSTTEGSGNDIEYETGSQIFIDPEKDIDDSSHANLKAFLKGEDYRWVPAKGTSNVATLTITERSYKMNDTAPDCEYVLYIFGQQKHTVKLIIEGTVNLYSEKLCAIGVNDSNLEITGTGVLNVNGINSSSSMGSTLSIKGGITVNSIGDKSLENLTSQYVKCGIIASSLIVSGEGTVLNALGGEYENQQSFGAYMRGVKSNIKIDGAIANFVGSKAGASYGVQCTNLVDQKADITIEGGGSMTAKSSNEGQEGYGIYIRGIYFDITVKGSIEKESSLSLYGKTNGLCFNLPTSNCKLKDWNEYANVQIKGDGSASFDSIGTQNTNPNFVFGHSRNGTGVPTPITILSGLGGAASSNNYVEGCHEYTIVTLDDSGFARKIDHATSGTTTHTLPEAPTPPSDKVIFDHWEVRNGEGEVVTYTGNEFQLSTAQGFYYLTPVWKNVYDVSYYLDSAPGQEPVYVDQKIHDEYTLPACTMEKYGYEFKGWLVRETGEYKNPGDKITVDGDRTIVALWDKLPVVIYYLDDSASGPFKTVPVKGTYTLEEPAQKDGYNFKGWLVNGEMKQVGDKITVTSDTVVVGVWEQTNNNILWLIVAFIIAILVAAFVAVVSRN